MVQICERSVNIVMKKNNITDGVAPYDPAKPLWFPHDPDPAHNSLQGKPRRTEVPHETLYIPYIYPAQ
jgi:hypothetical protein